MTKNNLETVLITGGLGFIGSHTCLEIIKYYNIIIIDNLSNSKLEVLDKLKQISNKDINFYEIDLLDEDKLDSVFNIHKPEYVIHFAALKSVGESIRYPQTYYTNNITGTLNLIHKMDKYDCHNLIFSSSATVYGMESSPMTEEMIIGKNLTNPYGRTKYMMEEILKDLTISDKKWNIISLRYFNPIGSHSSGLIGENPNGIPNNLMPFILKVAVNNNTEKSYSKEFNVLNIFGNDYKTNDGTCERDFIHVEDLSLGHLCALNKIEELNGYNVFNLGTGNPTSILSLITTFENVNKVKIPYIIKDRRNGDIQTSYCDPSLTNKILGWKTNKTIKDMCKDSWNYQLKNIK